MIVSLINNILLESFIGISILSLFSVYFAGKMSFYGAYLFNYFHWRTLIFPYKIKVINKFFYILRMGADKTPFVTLTIVLTEKLNISLLYASLITIIAGILRLASTYDWRTSIPRIKKWRFELGLLQGGSISMQYQAQDANQKLLNNLAHPNQNNKFEISKTDFRCYIALALLFMSVPIYNSGNYLIRLDIIAFCLITWCTIDALMWNFKFNHRSMSKIENFQENIFEFFMNFWPRIIVVLLMISLFFSSHFLISYEFSRYHVAGFIFFIMFLNKTLRIWNEALIAKLNLQKEYYPASYHRDHLFKFENARIWRDIGALRSEAVNPLVRLVMFRTMFELSERSLFIGIITHLDLILATFFYAMLITK
jgi:hypothetical protein